MVYKIFLLLILYYIRVVKCINNCENVTNTKEYFWKNEGAAVIYIMKSTQQNWQDQVSSLIHLKSSLQNIGVNIQVTIATDKNCPAFKYLPNFKVDTGEIWNSMEHHKDYPEAYIIDRCGKVTYHIIFPWSLVKWFPFVKGALLSTFFDKPCGPCDIFHSYQVETLKDTFKSEEIKLYPKITSNNFKRRYDGGVPPINIIIKERHKHEGSDEIYEYTEMEIGNEKYHRHFHQLDEDEFLSYDDYSFTEDERILHLDTSDKKDNSEIHFKHSTYKTKTKREEKNTPTQVENKKKDIDSEINEIVHTCTDLNNLEQDSEYYGKLFHNLLNIMYSSEESLSSNEKKRKEKLTHHYEKLNNWISYII